MGTESMEDTNEDGKLLTAIVPSINWLMKTVYFNTREFMKKHGLYLIIKQKNISIMSASPEPSEDPCKILDQEEKQK